MKKITGETLVKSNANYTSGASQWESKLYKGVAFVLQMLRKPEDNNSETLHRITTSLKNYKKKKRISI